MHVCDPMLICTVNFFDHYWNQLSAFVFRNLAIVRLTRWLKLLLQSALFLIAA